MAKEEKTNMRTKHYSLRHRKYGNSLSAIDIDWIEFDSSHNPVMIIDEKHPNCKEINLNEDKYKNQIALGRLLNIPFYIAVVYVLRNPLDKLELNLEAGTVVKLIVGAEHEPSETDHFQFAVYSVRLDEWKKMTEKEFVGFLFSARGEKFGERGSPDIALSDSWDNLVPALPSIRKNDKC